MRPLRRLFATLDLDSQQRDPRSRPPPLGPVDAEDLAAALSATKTRRSRRTRRSTPSGRGTLGRRERRPGDVRQRAAISSARRARTSARARRCIFKGRTCLFCWDEIANHAATARGVESARPAGPHAPSHDSQRY